MSSTGSDRPTLAFREQDAQCCIAASVSHTSALHITHMHSKLFTFTVTFTCWHMYSVWNFLRVTHVQLPFTPMHIMVS